MKKHQRSFPVAAAVVVILISGSLIFAKSTKASHPGKIFAQQLVESTQASHPEVDEVGISAVTKRGCIGIASTDKSDIGEKCEAEDVRPMHTGKPVIEHEKDGFDVSLPLHDSSHRLIGSVGFGFKPAPGQTRDSVVKQARAIAAEMEQKISSKSQLFARASEK